MSRRDQAVNAIRTHRARQTRVWIWCPDWVERLVGRALLCYAPPTPAPTDAEIATAEAARSTGPSDAPR